MATSFATRPDVSPEQLRDLRRRAGLTQREVAGMADCSIATVANMEHGYIPKAGAVLHRVLDVLNDERRPAGAAAVKEPRRQARRD